MIGRSELDAHMERAALLRMITAKHAAQGRSQDFTTSWVAHVKHAIVVFLCLLNLSCLPLQLPLTSGCRPAASATLLLARPIPRAHRPSSLRARPTKPIASRMGLLDSQLPFIGLVL